MRIITFLFVFFFVDLSYAREKKVEVPKEEKADATIYESPSEIMVMRGVARSLDSDFQRINTELMDSPSVQGYDLRAIYYSNLFFHGRPAWRHGLWYSTAESKSEKSAGNSKMVLTEKVGTFGVSVKWTYGLPFWNLNLLLGAGIGLQTNYQIKFKTNTGTKTKGGTNGFTLSLDIAINRMFWDNVGFEFRYMEGTALEGYYLGAFYVL